MKSIPPFFTKPDNNEGKNIILNLAVSLKHGRRDEVLDEKVNHLKINLQLNFFHIIHTINCSS